MPSVAEIHCEVFVENDQLIVRDMATTTGTLVNGQPITTAPLADGDAISVGPSTFIVDRQTAVLEGVDPASADSLCTE